ncbi:Citryl-CoA lyase [uncultured delta proteobacterium]|uniref:Citryl-CoA lyase n=1 Tax=uncultured delta proteobacterium TaxID=34034 RepID=A0A212K1H3_9DELT|nr:Citryl-CoA lyase [uncultured delta proteobacterium]
MAHDYAMTKVRRSRFIMPVHQKEAVEKAHTRNADAVVLDLEDTVPAPEKLAARAAVKESIPLVLKGGSEVIVRVNHTPELLQGDLEGAVWPGLGAIYLPKCETREEVAEVEKIIARLEVERGLAPGSVTINAVIETPRGYLNAEEIAKAGDRVDSIALGNEDFCSTIDLISSPETRSGMLAVRMHLLIVARAYGKIPIGMIDSMTGFADTAGFEEVARLSYKYGFQGSSCMHPSSVEILNRCFTPTAAEAAAAQEIIRVMEDAIAKGVAAASLGGRMIDMVHYNKAKALLARVELIEAHEARKRKARGTSA